MGGQPAAMDEWRRNTKAMRFMLVYIGGEHPRLQFINDALFAAFCAAGGGIRPPIPTMQFEDWVWELPRFDSFYDVPAFSPSQLVDAMMWAHDNGLKVHDVPPLRGQFPRIRFSPASDDDMADDDL
jgi:hypothetical protein